MKIYLRLLASIAVLVNLCVAGVPRAERRTQTSAGTIASVQAREDAYRANNLGVALLEQFNYREGAEAFRRALGINPQLAIARINLAIALYNVPDMEAALREARTAVELAPRAPQPLYILGLIARAQNRTEDAVAAFQSVLEMDSQDVGANVQLGQLYAQERRYGEASAVFRTALAAEPYNATAIYNLAIVLARAGQRDEGAQLLRRFQELRQSGAGTTIGQNYLEQGRYAEAITSTGAEPHLVDARTPEVTFTDATANVLPVLTVQNEGRARGSRRARGNRRARPPTNSARPNTIFNHRFANADLNDAAKREIAATFGAGVTLFDFDADGDLDLFDVAPQRLLRNDTGRFIDVTAQSGALSEVTSSAAAAITTTGGVAVGAVAGDYDNDTKPDLFVLRYGAPCSLYHNEGDGRFTDRTAAARITAFPHLSISVAFVDADHDGDLDLFVPGFTTFARAPRANDNSNLRLEFPADFAGAPNILLRNNGDGTFADITEAARLTGTRGHAVAVVPTDFDNRRDVDLLVVNYGEAPALWRNLRDGSFRDVAAEVGLGAVGRFTCAGVGDANKDGFSDFFFGRTDAPGVFAMSDGRGRFRVEPLPSAPPDMSNAQLTEHTAAQFLDYDNDGLLDLITLRVSASGGGVRVWRNTGERWTDVSEGTVAGNLLASVQRQNETTQPRAFASGDTDRDGDVDLILRSASGEMRFARNEGGNRNASIRVQLTGRVSNRSGVGAKIEMRAGSLRQKTETYSANPAPAPADTVFGLGGRTRPDAVRVIWPAGIVQAETEIITTSAANRRATSDGGVTGTSRASGSALGGASGGMLGSASLALNLSIIELDRKPSSCPFLYTWNGERFEFITDMMGGGEMGYWVAPGTRNQPDPDEYVRIRADQLRERDGRFEIRVTNELEEALFMDRLQLLAVTHAEGVEVYPNEGLGNPTSSTFQLYATRDVRPPRRATDDHGRDVLQRLTRLDRQYPDDFRVHRIRGYAEPHTLTLDLGSEAEGANRILLLMTGWTDYAFSSDNVAAAQRGLQLQPPALQVRDARGNWQTVIENIGIPVGRPQTVPIDLTGKFLTSSREVRIVTNMRIYWDQILVDTSDGDFQTESTRLEPQTANLRWRGFSREATPDGREPFGYTYAHVSFDSPWKLMTGRYTREGDVVPLLTATDDMFVISRSGDEIAVAFDARNLPALRHGWARTFLLYVDGYSKEMDINSSSPDGVAPLPFHGMSGYPYRAPEEYPMTEARRAYIERYNTRIVTGRVPSIEASILAAEQERSIRATEESSERRSR